MSEDRTVTISLVDMFWIATLMTLAILYITCSFAEVSYQLKRFNDREEKKAAIIEKGGAK